jgi:hypothetical protein
MFAFRLGESRLNCSPRCWFKSGLLSCFLGSHIRYSWLRRTCSYHSVDFTTCWLPRFLHYGIELVRVICSWTRCSVFKRLESLTASNTSCTGSTDSFLEAALSIVIVCAWYLVSVEFAFHVGALLSRRSLCEWELGSTYLLIDLVLPNGWNILTRLIVSLWVSETIPDGFILWGVVGGWTDCWLRIY